MISLPRSSSSDDTSKKLSLRSLWKIGDKFPVCHSPSGEGMVAATKWRDGVFSVVFITPPYQQKGGTWAEAAISYRTPTSFERKAFQKYDYPFPSDSRILQEAQKANGNIEILQEITKFLNKAIPAAKEVEGKLEEQQELSVWEEEESHEEEMKSCLGGTNFSIQKVQTQQNFGNGGSEPAEFFSAGFIEKLAMEVSKRLSVTPPPTHNVETSSCGSFSKKKKSKKIGKDNSLGKSSSSSSSDESSTSSSSSTEVGKYKHKGGTGWFECPFSSLDARHTTSPSNTMKGKFEERKMLRKALQNLYAEFTTLKWYVDSLKAETAGASFKPYAMDLVWLSHHAKYLDQLLLHSSRGPWKLWNELFVDFVARAFLELLVRASPTRAYPEIHDEKVRKWMRKRRVGLSSQFGPIPPFLADAKVSDAGIQTKKRWNPFPRRENRFPAAVNKPRTTPRAGNEKKPPV